MTTQINTSSKEKRTKEDNLQHNYCLRTVSSNDTGGLNLVFEQKGCNIKVIKQSACLSVNPVTADHFVYLFYCTPVGRGSDSIYDGPDLKTTHKMA